MPELSKVVTGKSRRKVEVIDLVKLPRKETKKAVLPYKCGNCQYPMRGDQAKCALCGMDWMYRIAQ